MFLEIRIPKEPIPLEEKFPGCWIAKDPGNLTYYDFFDTLDVFKKKGGDKEVMCNGRKSDGGLLGHAG